MIQVTDIWFNLIKKQNGFYLFLYSEGLANTDCFKINKVFCLYLLIMWMFYIYNLLSVTMLNKTKILNIG
jgi:hypothetical protein